MLEKLKSRTELHAVLVGVLTVVLNRTLKLELTVADIATIAGLLSSYAVSRGFAKHEPRDVGA